MTHIHHQSYTVEGITDAAVLAAQAEKRRDKADETTIVHAHPYEHDNHEIECTQACRIFQPGFKTRSIYAVPEKVEES
jgi:hypothetical protein